MMVVNGHKTITSVLISGETINYNLFRWISIRRSRGDMPIVVVRKINLLDPDLQIILFLFRIRLQLQNTNGMTNVQCGGPTGQPMIETRPLVDGGCTVGDHLRPSSSSDWLSQLVY